METIVVYEITKETSCDGMSPNKPTGICFYDEARALEFVLSPQFQEINRASMGQPKTIKDGKSYYRERELYVFNDVKEYDENIGTINRDKLRREALEKLTDAEKKALGVDKMIVGPTDLIQK